MFHNNEIKRENWKDRARVEIGIDNFWSIEICGINRQLWYKLLSARVYCHWLAGHWIIE